MKKCKLGKYIQVKHGYPFKSQFFSDKGKYIILTPGNFFEEGGFKTTPGKEKYYLDEFPQEYLCRQGDLIVVMTEQVRGLLGSTALVPEDEKYLHNQRIGLITYDDKVFSRDYLNYLFRTKTVRTQLEGSASGTKIKHTSPDRICSVEVEIPSLEEQQKIGKLLKGIDDKITFNNATIATLESLAKTLYDYYFLQFDFPDEKGRPYKSSGGKMVWNEELGREIPVGWKVKHLFDFVEIKTETEDPQLFPQKTYEHYSIPSYDGGKYPVIEKGAMINSSKYKVTKGDILYSKLNPAFKRIWRPFCFSENAICSTEFLVFKTMNPEYHDYIYGVMNDDSFQTFMIQQSSSSTGSRKRVQPYNCLRYGFAVPDEYLINQYSRKYKYMLTLIEKNIKENRYLSSLRDFLLPLLMNGQVTFR